MPEKFIVRDIDLAPQGRLKIDWVSAHMPVLNQLKERFINEQPFKGKCIAMSIHLEAKTAYLAEVLHCGGAEIAISGSNPLSTQDDVAAALAAAGLRVFAWHGATDEEYEQHLLKVLDCSPDIVIDDGGDLTHLLHTVRKDLAGKIIGGSEETTTGVLRLKSMAEQNIMRYPMIAVNDSQCKYLFDNRYGTGESVWSGIMRTTNLLTAGKTAVVFGYGWCGKGVALRAKGLGARVIICETNPVRALEAHMDGHEIMPSLQAAEKGDIFITDTGCCNVLRKEHFARMKNGAVLANAGHFDVEINVKELEKSADEVRTVRSNIEEFVMPDGRKIYLLARGRLVNLAAGDGHPAEIMDMSFALQSLAACYLIEHQGELDNKVYTLPPELDYKVAELKILSLGKSIDQLTEEQQTYLHSWQ